MRLATEKGVLPVSKTEIAQAAGLDLPGFDAAFPSLEALQEAVWLGYLRRTLALLEQSGEFAAYSVREKALAFYYSFFELLARDRAFVCMFAAKLGIWNYEPAFLRGFKAKFLAFVGELVQEGIESKEIEERVMLGGEYAGWHWPQLLFLLNKWIDDQTEAQSATDQAIEKSVNLGFDIMGRNVLDSAFDFAKFMVVGK